MNHPILEGKLFVRLDAPLPNDLNRRLVKFADGWSTFQNVNDEAVDKAIKSVDWHLFFLVTPVSGMSMHVKTDEALRHAVIRALEKIEVRYNTAEVGHITMFKLGPVTFAAVTMHPRQIQESGVMESKHYDLPKAYPEV